MKNLITLAILSIGAISFQSAANDQALVSAPLLVEQESQVEGDLDSVVLRHDCCYQDPREPRFCMPHHSAGGVSEAEMFAAAKPMALSAPIYIGGARYNLNKSDFNPVYKTRVIYDPCYMDPPFTYRQLVGYEVSFPVDGDFGQNLNYDIVGRSNKSMSLSASCGSFSGSDSGTKYVIATQKNTGGSCKNMSINFSFTGSAPSYIDLSVTISENL